MTAAVRATAMVTVALIAFGCSAASDGSAPAEQPATSARPSNASTGSADARVSVLSETDKAAFVAWCSLTIGESFDDVLRAMGPPHGNKTKYYRALGEKTVDLEWDFGETILWATFTDKEATSLRAFRGSVNQLAASPDVPCEALRK